MTFFANMSMKVKYVDAAKLRNTLDTDFSGYGTSDFYLYIPKGEIWLDKKLKDETEFYLALNRPAIVLKQSLLYIPFYGWFLWKATAIAIDRSAGASAFWMASALGGHR